MGYHLRVYFPEVSFLVLGLEGMKEQAIQRQMKLVPSMSRDA